jgi:hypothetical protein
MTARETRTSLWRARDGASAAEFALVLPLLLLLLFGVIDAGRFLYTVNMSEKATQMGARYAIVTNVIPPRITNATYVGEAACSERAATGNICQPGDFIDIPGAIGELTCSKTSCICTQGQTCPSGQDIDGAAFDALVARMAAMRPGITADNVRVVFRGSGIGYVSDPGLMDAIPLVTVRLEATQFRPLVLFGAAAFTLPAFATTLSAEDSVGTQAN